MINLGWKVQGHSCIRTEAKFDSHHYSVLCFSGFPSQTFACCSSCLVVWKRFSSPVSTDNGNPLSPANLLPPCEYFGPLGKTEEDISISDEVAKGKINTNNIVFLPILIRCSYALDKTGIKNFSCIKPPLWVLYFPSFPLPFIKITGFWEGSESALRNAEFFKLVTISEYAHYAKPLKVGPGS